MISINLALDLVIGSANQHIKTYNTTRDSSAYFISKQLLPFGFTIEFWTLWLYQEFYIYIQFLALQSWLPFHVILHSAQSICNVITISPLYNENTVLQTLYQ